MSDNYSRKPNMDSEFNKNFFDNSNKNGQTAYTFIYRFQDDDDFTWKEFGPYCHPATILQFNVDEPKKYLLKVVTNMPSILIFHDRSYAQNKNCTDCPHFHVIVWAKQHPSSNYAFSKLKDYMKSPAAKKQYDMTCPMVFKPDGLIDYFVKGQIDRQLLCTNDLTTTSQKLFMERLTNKDFSTTVQSDEHL